MLIKTGVESAKKVRGATIGRQWPHPWIAKGIDFVHCVEKCGQF